MGCPLYHVKKVFNCLFPPFVLGYKSVWKIKCRLFQYSLKLSPGTILWSLFNYFHVFTLLTYISDPCAPTLARGIFVEAGPRQAYACPYSHPINKHMNTCTHTSHTHKMNIVHNMDLFRQKLPAEVNGNSHGAWPRWSLSRTRTSLMSHLCSSLHPKPGLSLCLSFSGWNITNGTRGVSQHT